MLKSNKQGDPDANRGITINTSHVEYQTANRLIWSPRSNIDGPDDDCDSLLIAFLSKKGYDYYQAQSALQSTGLSKKGYDYYQAQSALQSTGASKKGYDYYQAQSALLSKKGYDYYQAQSALQSTGVHGRVTRLTTSHGQTFTWTYDAAGNLTSAISPVPSKGTLYQHDAQGRLTGVTTTNGAAGNFHDALAYGPDGFLQTFTEDATPGGRNLATTFDYDTLGRVTRIVDPMSADWLLTWSPLDLCTRTESPPVAGQRIATDFAYDSSACLVRCDVELRDRFGNADPGNPACSTFWSYDSRGRLARFAVEERPTDNSGLLEPDPASLSNFAVTDYTYDHAGQVVRLSTPAACRGQSTDSVLDLSYDERGLLHRCIPGGDGNPDGFIIDYDYDDLGACVREACLAPDGGETLYSYDGFHRLDSVTDGMGNVATFDYGNDGYVTCSVHGEVEDAPGGASNTLLFRLRKRPEILFAEWDGSDIQALTYPGVTDVCYDLEVKNSAAKTSGPRENTQSNEWIVGSSRLAIKTKGTSAKREACNPFLSLVTEDDTVEVERFSPTDSPPFAKETTVIDRSPAGLVMSITRNGDLLASYGYDSSGALHSISNAASTIDLDRDGRQDVVLCGKTDHFRVTSPPAPKTYSHSITRDSLGRITAVTDGAGNASSFAYDSLGRCTSLAEPGRPPVTFAYDGGDATGPFSVVAACDIDNTGSPVELGRSLIRCGAPVSSSDSNGYTRSFTYDALGRLSRCNLPDGTFEATTYDARGYQATCVFSDGSSRDITCDKLGRVIHITPVNDPPTVISSPPTAYAYDGLGRMVSAAQGASTVTMTWDSVGNPLSETSDGLTVSRSFNHRGRTSVSYPNTTPINEARNEFGQLTNAGGNLVRYVGMCVYQTVQTNGIVTTYSYRGEGDSSPPGDSSYGSCVRVTARSGATTLADTFIEHTPDQRVLAGNGRYTDEATGQGRVRSYTYDGLGRVITCLTERRETLGGPLVTESDLHYTLDTAGRRIAVTGGSHAGAYTQSAILPPGDHQIGQYTTWPGGALEWDDRGNLTTYNDGPDYRDLDSDGDGRLVAVNDGGSGTPMVNYTYDALGRLASRTEFGGGGLPPSTTSFVWDGSIIAQELDDPSGTGELSAALTFVNGDGGIQHCISTRNGTLYYPINTHAKQSPSDITVRFGHSIAISDDLGAVLERYDHDEAGELLLLDSAGVAKTTAIGPVRWMAPEALRDASTGFVHGHGTVYSPPLGREITVEKFHVTESFGQTPASRKE